MKAEILNILYDSKRRLESMKKSEMKLSERIKIEISIRNIEIVIRLINTFSF